MKHSCGQHFKNVGAWKNALLEMIMSTGFVCASMLHLLFKVDAQASGTRYVVAAWACNAAEVQGCTTVYHMSIEGKISVTTEVCQITEASILASVHVVDDQCKHS
jgi:hypothetical protein